MARKKTATFWNNEIIRSSRLEKNWRVRARDVVNKYRWYPAQLKALQNGKPRPRTKKWKQIESVLGDYLQLALIGQMSAQDAMDRANKDIDKALR